MKSKELTMKYILLLILVSLCSISATEYSFPGSATAQDKLVSVAGEQVEFIGYAISNCEIVKYKWDFNNDGTFDATSDSTGNALYTYDDAGSYEAVFKAVDAKGIETTQWIVYVTVTNTPEEAEQVRNTPEPTPPDLTPIVNPADGIETRYALLINSDKEQRFVDDMIYTYEMLIGKGLLHENIFLFNTDGDPIKDKNGNLKDNITVDGPCLEANLIFGCQEIAQAVDQDDLLFMWISDHGTGYEGKKQLHPQKALADGNLDSKSVDVGAGNEYDYLEKDFKLESLRLGTHYGGKSCTKNNNFHCGLDEWRIHREDVSSQHGDYKLHFRRKYVSHFDEIDFVDENCGTASDNDVYIEKITDYLISDSNRNGRIDGNEKADGDGNGNGKLPYDPATGEFDEGDWGQIDKYTDNIPYKLNTLVPGTKDINDYILFDKDLDNKLDIDISPIDKNDPSTFVADGTDLDNQGLFDGIDLNGDGDKNDWVHINEEIVLNDGRRMSDDQFKDLLEPINPGAMIIILQQCYSGGFIKDLAKPGRIIISSTHEEMVSWGNKFLISTLTALNQRNYPEAGKYGTKWDPETADYNDDGQISISETFQFAAFTSLINEDPNDPLPNRYDFPHFDGNGDGIPALDLGFDPWSSPTAENFLGDHIFLEKDLSQVKNFILENKTFKKLIGFDFLNHYGVGFDITIKNSNVRPNAVLNVKAGKEIRVLPDFTAPEGSEVIFKAE